MDVDDYEIISNSNNSREQNEISSSALEQSKNSGGVDNDSISSSSFSSVALSDAPMVSLHSLNISPFSHIFSTLPCHQQELDTVFATRST